jgi:hypothetical protein
MHRLKAENGIQKGSAGGMVRVVSDLREKIGRIHRWSLFGSFEIEHRLDDVFHPNGVLYVGQNLIHRLITIGASSRVSLEMVSL